MGKTLIITEKGTQAEALASIMQRSKNISGIREGVYEGIEFIIVPLSGHILEADVEGINFYNFSPPEKLLPRSKPLMDSEFKRRIHKRIKTIRDQYFSDIDAILMATDPDPEGCGIGEEVIEYYGFDVIRDITYMDMSNTSKQALKKSLEYAIRTKKDHLDWRRFAFASHLRSDFSLTGLASTMTMNKVLKDKGINAFYTLGTQQFRILDLVVSRYKEHNEFDKSPKYRIKAHTPKGTFVGELDDAVDIRDKSAVEAVAHKIEEGGTISVTGVKHEKKLEKSPKWMDGSHIGSKVAKKTKESIGKVYSDKKSVMQGMYEQGLITYIRGEAKGKMPEGDFETYAKIAEHIAKHYHAPRLDATLKKPYLWRKEDSKETVNHTPCTLADMFDISKFSGIERAVIDEAAKQILATFYPDTKTVRYLIEGEAGGNRLKIEESETIDLGWKEIYGIKPTVLPNPDIATIGKGDMLRIKSVEVESYIPTPPPLFTEATLLEAIKKKGIGSDSTFGSMINFILDRQTGSNGKTVKRGYCKLNDKKQIIPTAKGIFFNDAFPKEIKEIIKAFESGIFKLYLDGELDEHNALEYKNKLSAKFYEETTRIFLEKIDQFASFGDSIEGGKSASKRRETDIPCPLCGANIIETNKVWQCSRRKYNKETGENSGCDFVLFKDSTKGKRYTITEEVLRTLCRDGVADIVTRNAKSHKSFTEKIKLTDDKLHAEIV